jgi:hypothetical protein
MGEHTMYLHEVCMIYKRLIYRLENKLNIFKNCIEILHIPRNMMISENENVIPVDFPTTMLSKNLFAG